MSLPTQTRLGLAVIGLTVALVGMRVAYLAATAQPVSISWTTVGLSLGAAIATTALLRVLTSSDDDPPPTDASS